MSNNNHISKCVYSAEIIAYLYGEIAKKEKSAFETHLASCSNCTDELADFAFARFSIQEWRDAEFAHLETPVIKIPFERKKENITDSTFSADSWLARLRGLVSLSPAWAAAGGAVALAVGFGLVFAAINIFQPAEIAEVNNDNSVKIAVSPTTEIAVQKPESVFPDNQNTKSFPEQSSRNKKSDNSKNTVVKISENARKNNSAKQFPENTPANNRVVSKTADKAVPSKARQVPGLVAFEEDEDKTLRLAELFDEFDTEK